ncbi:MAG: hypothetical protein ACQEVA_13800 [Myxococcota bacterium]
MISRVSTSNCTPTVAAVFALAALVLCSDFAMAGDSHDVRDARTPHASFQHSDGMHFDTPDANWDTGIQTDSENNELDSEPLVVLERPSILVERDGFGLVRSQNAPSFRISDQSLSINMVRLGEALKATAQWYQRPRKVAADAKLVVDSFYHFGKEVVDEGLVLVRSRSEQKGLQAKLGPTWMRGGPAARLKVSF